jgi:hypothetical protein
MSLNWTGSGVRSSAIPGVVSAATIGVASAM